MFGQNDISGQSNSECSEKRVIRRNFLIKFVRKTYYLNVVLELQDTRAMCD